MPELYEFVDANALEQLIAVARHEDLGPRELDVTSVTFIPESLQGRAIFNARQGGTLAGAALLSPIAQAYGADLAIDHTLSDGASLTPGAAIATVSGPMRAVLAYERVALNLLTHLSGIASLTQRFTDAIQAAGGRAKVYDTRKTLPGLRGLQKYAVACGGGGTHRMGLHDAMLIKDNHLAHLPLDRYAESLADAIAQARSLVPNLQFAMVEVDTLEQLERILKVPGLDIVLLDNMGPPLLTQAVTMRDAKAPNVLLEASGGVNLNTVGPIAATGVDRISVGALTHSAVALDIGLDKSDS